VGREPSWKQHQDKSKLKNLLAVFITVTLLFVIANGIAKGFSLKNSISDSQWDSKSSFTVAVDSLNPSVFIFKPDSKSIVVLALAGDVLYETGSFNTPLEKISSVIDKTGGELTSSLSQTYGTKIDNFIKLGEKSEIEKDSAQKMFIDFASVTTPFKILTSGYSNNISSTNITRIDAFKLWWQLKGASANSLKFADLSSYQEEIINKENAQVLGADTASLHRIISEYMDNFEVIEEAKNIRMRNGSRNTDAGRLASLFVASVGGKVIDVSEGDSRQDKTQIVAADKNSYTASYLAKIFDCDITEAKNFKDEGEIMVIIGSDFASKYFK